ncbi:30S ribosomal protein S8 [Patescibacteria group bacterium]|jgi:small subunit ribosomal protein S8|nr:30S ribosomal protein S8 [Patescibacteria group bacterium]MCL5114775.1 30S ribosomal protein S8 [Patescibacteria group bacterium]
MYIDLIIKIKNAQKAKKETVKSRYSKLDKAVVDILEMKGFVKNSEVKGKGYKKYIEMNVMGRKTIQGIRILSKPSVKQYLGYRDIRSVKSGFGTLILSTPKGILSGSDAKKLGVGGQLLFEIW